ncbi:MAG: rhodanese-like domain-containing protein [Parvibaculum sp.]|jgi:rhodanese-related sulfurtransferase|uniref:rhodanese-like domain-containing protein n=1 Tax=Parvibaculum sp. TaxID=2024848 RepID=UPI0028442651|nr:rhodanese-like domain-containing protein [Parvibaculum sp.]MDR3500772.1 rhodanese-like domain-containing protein [Parvibaculum sp.]
MSGEDMSDKAGENVKPQILGGRPGDYAGDVSSEEAWRVLSANPDAVLVDVRTRAEWSYVGLADLGALGKEALLAEWQSFPTMSVNAAFVDEVGAALGSARKDAPVFLLCRSGVRSRAAAIALTKAGFSQAYNVAGGFEGDLDETRHRGRRNGWKASGLPWFQG